MEFSEEEGYYVITRVHREDVVARVGQKMADLLTDEDMAYIARKMGDAYVGHGGFWEDLEFFVEGVLERKEVKTDEP